MKDNDRKYLYISGVLLMMALSSGAYLARTYHILGMQTLQNLNGQVFLAGTMLFAGAAIAAFCMYLRSKTKE